MSVLALPRRRLIGILLITLSAASFGTLAIFGRLAYDAGASPITVLFLRFTIASVVMCGVMFLRRERWPRGRLLLSLILMGGVGYVGQSLGYFLALTLASASLVALMLYLYPAIVTLLAAILGRERLTAIKLFALVLALTGTALTIGAIGGGQPLGIVFGVGGAIIYAVYILVGSTITPRAGALASSTIIMLAAAAVFAGVNIAHGPDWPTTSAGWFAIIGIALIPTVVAILTFFAGLERVGPTDAAMLSTFEPIVTVALAAIILHDRLAPLQFLGGALILGAVLLLARRPPEATFADVPPPEETFIGEAS